MALNFRKADRLRNFLTGVKLRWRLSNESCVSAATTCTSAFGRLLWERFFTVNESQQTVETDTQIFVRKIFVRPDIYENIVTTKISRSTVPSYNPREVQHYIIIML